MLQQVATKPVVMCNPVEEYMEINIRGQGVNGMSEIDRRGPKSSGVLYWSGIALALLLIVGALRLFEVSRQEYKAWAAVTQWFSVHDKYAPVRADTRMPHEATVLKGADLVNCFRRVKPSLELLRIFEDENLHQRSIRFGRDRLQHSVDKDDNVLFWDWLASTLIDERSSDAEPVKEIVVSRVGISSEGDAALVYAEYLCPLCGYGGYFLLERQGSSWGVADVCMIWVS